MKVVWLVPVARLISANFSEVAFTHFNMVSKSRGWVLIAICIILWTAPSQAGATTINAASCFAADVQTAINRAVTGDTVTVPSGSCNWGDVAVYISGKNLTVQGAGIDVTKISGSGVPGYIWSIGIGDASNSTRLTGFTVTTGAHTAAVMIDGDGWRIDHIKFVSASPGVLIDGVYTKGLRQNAHGPTGLIDHVQFVDARPMIVGYPDVSENESSLWVSPLGLGDVNAVYIEDSTWTWNGAFPNGMDCNYGGRFVFRFNTVNASTSLDAHSNQGWRGCRRWEFYQNTINFGGTPFFAPMFLRGGTGTIFGNTVSAGFTYNYIHFDVVRAFLTGYGSMCNGTSVMDGAKLSNGWPCRDQIGWNTDTMQATAGNPWPPQVNEPVYIWSNTFGGSPGAVLVTNGTSAWIQPNRDYYVQGASFNGTAGVGVGPISSRPASCTTGVAYWATDEGEWNSKNPGNDGQLYKCVSTNTWAPYYKPYPYPHPLQAVGINQTTTDTPTNLRVN